MEELYHELGGLMMRIARTRHRVIESRIRDLGIHPSQHFVLMYLSRQGCIPSQAQLAGCMDVSPASVARMLKNLEAGGYIEREGGSTDSRRNETRITPKGQAVIVRSRALFKQLDDETYAGFTAAELDALRASLARLHERLCEIEQGEKKELKPL